MIIFEQAEENLGGEKKTNEERNRRASIFLPINPLKMAKIDEDGEERQIPVRCI